MWEPYSVTKAPTICVLSKTYTKISFFFAEKNPNFACLLPKFCFYGFDFLEVQTQSETD